MLRASNEDRGRNVLVLCTGMSMLVGASCGAAAAADSPNSSRVATTARRTASMSAMFEPVPTGGDLLDGEADGAVRGTPTNDACADALPILDGVTSFDTSGATTDGLADPLCEFVLNDQIRNDIWYDYTATCTDTLTVSTCGSATFDTKIAIYEGLECPATQIIACDDDSCEGVRSVAEVFVLLGDRYKIRVGSFRATETGTGIIAIVCGDVPTDCPGGAVVFVDPPDGVVDARQPHDVNADVPLQGIDTLMVEAPAGSSASCWSLCETDTGGLGANGVDEVVDHGDGTYTLTLARPMTVGAVTTLTYTSDAGSVTTGAFVAHPGNANGDTQTTSLDILAVIDYLNEVAAPPWGLYGTDINHDGSFGPTDILRLIDLLNGAGLFDAWNGTDRPEAEGCP